MPDTRKVLLVDDEPEHLLAMQMIFERPGDFEVFTAGSAAEADRVIDSREIDLIILDIALPGETGLEFAQRYRARPGGGETPIVAISAYPDYLWKEKALEAGCNEFVNKPFEPAKLIDLARSLTRPAAGR